MLRKVAHVCQCVPGNFKINLYNNNIIYINLGLDYIPNVRTILNSTKESAKGSCNFFQHATCVTNVFVSFRNNYFGCHWQSLFLEVAKISIYLRPISIQIQLVACLRVMHLILNPFEFSIQSLQKSNFSRKGSNFNLRTASCIYLDTNHNFW